MRFLCFLTYSSVLFLAIRAAGFNPNKLAALLLSLGAGVSIISFVRLGARAFYLFDPTSLASELVEQIRRSYTRISPGQFRWQDQAFQNHAYKSARSSLDTVETLAELTGKENQLSGQPFATLCKHLLALLINYSVAKKAIPTESRWYPRQYAYPDWYKSDDSATSMAYQSSGRLNPKEVSNALWLESSIMTIVHTCFRKNAEAERFDLVSSLISYIDAYARTLAHEHDVQAAFQMIEDLTAKCVDVIFAKIPASSDKENVEQIALVDAIASIPITIFLAYMEAITRDRRASITARLSGLRWEASDEIYKKNFPRHLISQLEYLYPRLEFERRSEGFRVSPNWYIDELVCQSSAENFKVALDALVSRAPKVFDSWLTETTNKKLNWIKATVVARESEYWSKIEYQYWRIEEHWQSLNAGKRIEGLPWPKVDFSLLQESRKARQRQIPRLMAEGASVLSLVERPEAYPDFAGQFLHTTGENILAALVENDAETVATVFPHFFICSLLQYERIGSTVDISDWRGSVAIKVAVAPMLDLMSLSGYSFLFAQLHDDESLSESVFRVWNNYLDKKKSDDKDISSFLALVISMTDSAFEIAHRGIIRTGWDLAVSSELRKLKRRRVMTRRDIMSSSTVAIHKSPLVRVMAGYGEFGSFNDGIDIFVEELLRKRNVETELKKNFRRRDLHEAIIREKRREKEAASSAVEDDEELDDE